MKEAAIPVVRISGLKELQLTSSSVQEKKEVLTAADFQELVMPHKDKLFRFAYSFLHDQDEAKDVVQDVLLKTWEELQSDKNIKNVEAWCMTLTKNKSLDKMKRKGYNPLKIEEQHQLRVETDTPQESAEQKDLVSKIRELIKNLPDNQRNVLWLKDMEGYAYKEICEILGLDMNVVKVSLHRARAYVRKHITKIDAYGIQ